jgi:hypothetical protein
MTSGQLRVWVIAAACATLMTGCADDPRSPGGGPSGVRPSGIIPGPHQTRVFEYPVEGVDLGQGWDREGVRKAIATCIHFAAREDTGQEQSMELSVVNDSSALMDKLDVSAEAQFKSIGYSVSGKAKYAKDTEVRSGSLNVLAYAKVTNGVAYVAPQDGGSEQSRIDLTPYYRDLARRDRVAFEQECGDGFVAAVHSGAELTAMLSFAETSTTARSAIEAAMSGSGWGFSAEGRASSTMQKAASAGTLRVTFYQTGGSGSPIPTSQDGFVSAIERLPALAAADAYNYQIRVQSYQSLPGYPGGQPEKHDSFRQTLATSYGRLLTLHGVVIETLEAIEQAGVSVRRYADAHDDQAPSAFRARMQALHDELVSKLRQIREIADNCAFYDEDMGPPDTPAIRCTLSADLDLRNDYAYRLRLPVPDAGAATPAARAARTALIIDQHVRVVSRRRCERDLQDPGCLLEREIEKLRQAL